MDWYPWGAEAFARARRERQADPPVDRLLAPATGATSWRDETFEDEATAALMNELFVNIKVDREERPDIDRIYQIAQQLLTQRGGGWPLTMFLTHDDQRPFFGGTYFPREPRYGMPAFTDLLLRVAEYYRDHGDGAASSRTTALMAAFDELDAAAGGGRCELHATRRSQLLAAQLAAHVRPARRRLRRRAEVSASADASSGCCATGTPAPTAPQPDLQALYMATLTLRRMAEGGLNDQLGGGFCRYSVDASSG